MPQPRVVVNGIVQCVGHSSIELQSIAALNGNIMNASSSVELLLDGSEESIQVFLQKLGQEQTPLDQVLGKLRNER
jgi:hydrogenase maturation factor HypF (carbamoyltransferase family)